MNTLPAIFDFSPPYKKCNHLLGGRLKEGSPMCTKTGFQAKITRPGYIFNEVYYYRHYNIEV